MKLLLCVFMLFLMNFGDQNQSAITIETEKVKGIICANAKQQEFMLKASGFWIPTKEQVLAAEEEIERFLTDKPPAQSPNLWQMLPYYKRQYFGFTVNGHKRIFCNFYCSGPKEPLTCKPVDRKSVIVDTGGDCFFQIEYDVEGRKVEKLQINGVPD